MVVLIPIKFCHKHQGLAFAAKNLLFMTKLFLSAIFLFYFGGIVIAQKNALSLGLGSMDLPYSNQKAFAFQVQYGIRVSPKITASAALGGARARVNGAEDLAKNSSGVFSGYTLSFNTNEACEYADLSLSYSILSGPSGEFSMGLGSSLVHVAADEMDAQISHGYPVTVGFRKKHVFRPLAHVIMDGSFRLSDSFSLGVQVALRFALSEDPNSLRHRIGVAAPNFSNETTYMNSVSFAPTTMLTLRYHWQ